MILRITTSNNIYKCILSGDIQAGEQKNTAKENAQSSAETQLTNTGSSTVFMSDQDKTKYLSWVEKLKQGDAEGKCWGGECKAVLAVGPNGCWAKYPDMSLSRAKKQALKQCNTPSDTIWDMYL